MAGGCSGLAGGQPQGLPLQWVWQGEATAIAQSSAEERIISTAMVQSSAEGRTIATAMVQSSAEERIIAPESIRNLNHNKVVLYF